MLGVTEMLTEVLPLAYFARVGFPDLGTGTTAHLRQRGWFSSEIVFSRERETQNWIWHFLPR
jgi:hypothetical protein